MFDIRSMPEQIAQETLAKAMSVEPATLGHFRLTGFPASRIRPLASAKKAVGTAVTLALPGADSTLLHHAVGLLRRGDILLIDRLGDTQHACVGGGMAVSLERAGLAAVIVDGLCTDLPELQACGLPIWGAGLTALTTRLLGAGGMMNGPVCIGGAAVSPGDLVIVDETGIAILPPGEAEADLGTALEMQAVGPGLIAQSGPSMPLGVLSGATSLVMSKLKTQTRKVAGQTNPL
jgi:4-hydroxy-4-methyl-2-oxoglutarate aldolase